MEKKKNKVPAPMINGGGTVNSEQSDENDRCVYCGRDSGIKSNTPIEERVCYIPGCGQLCGDCYIETYIRRENENLSFEEINYLINMCKEE